ncbi:hypothetical protein NP233_g6203 [Leucocoprinus birnbaumii]|uniref:Uncharacterized protein n=1 Tax=Leucocoprinus birnbaumii TaxID=56174 RepID=A0AAD5YVR7_9AGAR|nr:hypothetical protein NP233_g6203 [Leucocoprinus birnbaumii]
MPLSKQEISMLKELRPVCIQKRESDKDFKMSSWTRDVVLVEYASRFKTEADSSKQKQLYDWIRNHCRIHESNSDGDSDSDSSSSACDDSDANSSAHNSPSPKRRQGFRAIVIAKNKQKIKSMIQASCSVGDTPTPREYFTLWNNAVTKLIDTLSQEVRTQYEMEALQNESWQLHGPTVEEIYNNGKEYHKHKKPFLKKYDTYVAAEMGKLAALSLPKAREIPALPRHISTLEGRHVLLPMEMDDVSTNELKATLKAFIELTWKEENDTDEIPWTSLEDPKYFSEILGPHSALQFFPCLNPDKLDRETMEHLACQLALDPTLLTFQGYRTSRSIGVTNIVASVPPEVSTTESSSHLIPFSDAAPLVPAIPTALLPEELFPLTDPINEASQINPAFLQANASVYSAVPPIAPAAPGLDIMNISPSGLSAPQIDSIFLQTDTSASIPIQPSALVPLEIMGISPSALSLLVPTSPNEAVITNSGNLAANSIGEDNVNSSQIQSTSQNDTAQAQNRKKGGRKVNKKASVDRRSIKPTAPGRKALDPIQENGVQGPQAAHISANGGGIAKRNPSGRVSRVPDRAPKTITSKGQAEPERVPASMRFGWQSFIPSATGEIQVVEGLVGEVAPQTGQKRKYSLIADLTSNLTNPAFHAQKMFTGERMKKQKCKIKWYCNHLSSDSTAHVPIWPEDGYELSHRRLRVPKANLKLRIFAHFSGNSSRNAAMASELAASHVLAW